MYVRFVMRLAVKWAAGDMGETTVDNVVRSLTTLPCSSDVQEAEQAAYSFLNYYKTFCKKSFVSDDVIKRGSTAIMVPTDLSRVPLSLAEARRSYTHTLSPRTMRREFLKMKYNIDCECEGCLDEERNERMEGWRCLECEDGWLPPHANAKCSSVEHMSKYVNDLLSIEEQYLNKDDMELQYLRSVRAQTHITVADQNKYRFFSGMAE
ncbi:hypothetical protein TELCIR_12051, partial [Teladorsagia circumcincta]